MIASLAINNVPLVDPVVFPGCRLLVHATGASCLATLPFQYGTDVSWRVSLPEWLDPMTFHFQDWMFDGTIFYATRRLSVPVTK